MADRVEPKGDVDFYLHPGFMVNEDPRLYRAIFPRCPGCTEPASKEVTQHEGKTWHRRCVPKSEE